MIIRRTFYFAAVLFLAGCQTFNPTENLKRLNSGDACCTSFSEMKFKTLGQNQKLDIPIDEKSKIFNFEQGRRFFNAFALPKWNGPMQMTFYANTVGSGRNSGVVKPVIRMLDANHNETRSISPDVKKHWQGSHFEFTVFINEENKGERYIVVHPEAAGVEGSLSSKQYSPVQAGYGVLLVPVTVGSTSYRTKYRRAALGPMRIFIRPYGWKVESDS